MQGVEKSPFYCLPQEVLMHIFSFGNDPAEKIKELCKREKVCKLWRQLNADNTLWKPFLLEVFPKLYKKIDPKTENLKNLFSKTFQERVERLDKRIAALERPIANTTIKQATVIV